MMESFKKLMGGSLVDSWDTVPNGNWDIIEKLYDDYQKKTDKNQKIPKKIHQIWFGDMPESHKRLIPKIIEKHPDWEYKLWGEKDLDNYPMINKDMFKLISNVGAKSDIARYEILYNEGGVYLDSDFEMVGSFDELIDTDFFTGVGHSNEPMVFNGLIGSIKNSLILENLLYNLKEKFDFNNEVIKEDPMHLTGPYFFSKIFFDYVNNNKNENIVVLPTPYFYPLPATERFKIRNRFDELKNFIYSFNTEKTICIHLWYNSWQ